MTKAPYFIVREVLSEYTWTSPLVLLGRFDYLLFLKTLVLTASPLVPYIFELRGTPWDTLDDIKIGVEHYNTILLRGRWGLSAMPRIIAFEIQKPYLSCRELNANSWAKLQNASPPNWIPHFHAHHSSARTKAKIVASRLWSIAFFSKSKPYDWSINSSCSTSTCPWDSWTRSDALLSCWAAGTSL